MTHTINYSINHVLNYCNAEGATLALTRHIIRTSTELSTLAYLSEAQPLRFGHIAYWTPTRTVDVRIFPRIVTFAVRAICILRLRWPATKDEDPSGWPLPNRGRCRNGASIAIQPSGSEPYIIWDPLPLLHSVEIFRGNKLLR